MRFRRSLFLFFFCSSKFFVDATQGVPAKMVVAIVLCLLAPNDGSAQTGWPPFQPLLPQVSGIDSTQLTCSVFFLFFLSDNSHTHTHTHTATECVVDQVHGRSADHVRGHCRFLRWPAGMFVRQPQY